MKYEQLNENLELSIEMFEMQNGIPTHRAKGKGTPSCDYWVSVKTTLDGETVYTPLTPLRMHN